MGLVIKCAFLKDQINIVTLYINQYCVCLCIVFVMFPWFIMVDNIYFVVNLRLICIVYITNFVIIPADDKKLLKICCYCINLRYCFVLVVYPS